ncbi:GtrA family protein [Reichenbachiella versicolor]|uniref:GtrA family protein n=1 Tax=Reichenbachiella versicolor TaxID=1821036 RepID=UPI000D6DE670|nr:GtrA family protein [Reichenbachiella versicolor]
MRQLFVLDAVNRPCYRSLGFLSIVPILFSLLYFMSVNEQAINDWVFYMLLFGTVATNAVLLSAPLNMHLVIRFGIAIMVCALFNRNIYLIVLHHFNPIAASVSSQTLNLIFSYFVNQYFTYPAQEDNRKLNGGVRSLLYALAFTGEIVLHALISSNLLKVISPFWAWFITGAAITPYSLLILKVIFGTKKD